MKSRANIIFLIKNKKLEAFTDERMIIIMSIFVKLYDSLIKDGAINYIDSITIKENYQLGGIKNDSVFKSMIDLGLKIYMIKIKIFLLEIANG